MIISNSKNYLPPLLVVIAKNLGALPVFANEYKVRDWTYTTPLPAEMKATVIIALTKWPADFQPASSKPIVNGDEATFDVALSS